ncbi:MAG: KilA-N domain-containing protein [Candidatus Wallbacteria bacterium]|nr:KilA-N domain-containing protein [Candidatus Wallbacteria bacterium]
MAKISVLDKEIRFYNIREDDFISLTDIAKHKNPAAPADIVKNWLRTKNTIELLGLWEKLHNPDFKLVEFDQFRNEAGFNHFVLSPKQWIESTGAIGLVSRSGRFGGTFAHRDIAFEFASWVSVEFKLYLIKEFQRLKEDERKTLGWDIRRSIAKINYRIHTDAVKENLIPAELTKAQVNMIYAQESDVLNMALFGMTAKQWREKNPDKKGNMRDYADIAQLVCLSNLESMNAHFISSNMEQSERLVILNQIAISQMRLLTVEHGVKKMEGKSRGQVLKIRG